MRKISLLCVIIMSILTTHAFSSNHQIVQQGLTMEYELPPTEPLVFSNIFFWEIKAVCTVISEVPNNTLAVKMLRKTGSVNSQELTSGDLISLTVQPGDKLYIVASSGSQVELTNMGNDTIRASCSA